MSEVGLKPWRGLALCLAGQTLETLIAKDN